MSEHIIELPIDAKFMGVYRENGRWKIHYISSDINEGHPTSSVHCGLGAHFDIPCERYLGITFIPPTLIVEGKRECELLQKDWSLLRSLCKFKRCRLLDLASDAWGASPACKTIVNHISVIRQHLEESGFSHVIPPTRDGVASILKAC